MAAWRSCGCVWLLMRGRGASAFDGEDEDEDARAPGTTAATRTPRARGKKRRTLRRAVCVCPAGEGQGRARGRRRSPSRARRAGGRRTHTRRAGEIQSGKEGGKRRGVVSTSPVSATRAPPRTVRNNNVTHVLGHVGRGLEHVEGRRAIVRDQRHDGRRLVRGDRELVARRAVEVARALARGRGVLVGAGGDHGRARAAAGQRDGVHPLLLGGGCYMKGEGGNSRLSRPLEFCVRFLVRGSVSGARSRSEGWIGWAGVVRVCVLMWCAR